MSNARLSFFTVFVFALVFHAQCTELNIEQCFKEDSISCLQMQLFRKAKDIMNQPAIDLIGGISLVQEEGNSRAGKSLELEDLEGEVENATDVPSRQAALDKFLVRQARDIVVERTLRWNVGDTLRDLLNSFPDTLKASFTNYVTQARSKGKKLLRLLVPLLVGLKLKMAGLSAITYLVIAFLAKKAILAAVISLIVSGFIGLKKLIAAKQQPFEDSYAHPMPMWAAPTPWKPYDAHHAEPAAAQQQLAYTNHKSS